MDPKLSQRNNQNHQQAYDTYYHKNNALHNQHYHPTYSIQNIINTTTNNIQTTLAPTNQSIPTMVNTCHRDDIEETTEHKDSYGNIHVGSSVLYYETSESDSRFHWNVGGYGGGGSQPCFVGIITDIDHDSEMIYFMTTEYNENEPDHKFYCKKSVSFESVKEVQTLFAIHDIEAKKYAIANHRQGMDIKDIDFEANAKKEELQKIFVDTTSDLEHAANKLIYRRNIKQSIVNTHFLRVAHEAIISYYYSVIPSIYKISSTRYVHYGDGGEQHLRYPIFINDHLDVDEKQYEILSNELARIGNENCDYREDEPIQNVIDPELYALRLDRNVFFEEYKRKFSEMYRNSEDEESEKSEESSEDRDSDGSYHWNWKLQWSPYVDFKKNVYEKKWFIRGNYQWLPSVFTERGRSTDDCRYHFRILSSIHNIGPKEKNEKLYSSIAHVFQRMLPMFNKFRKFRDRKKDEFQVIVKSQRYEIEANKGYSGHWHQEGLTEHIGFVGIYYWEWDEGLTGGNMKFRPHEMPQKWYGNKDWCSPEVECSKHKAIVWDNEYFIHRVRMLKNLNNDGKIRRKGYLAFFIIDPENELANTTQNIVTLKREDYIDTLYKEVILKQYDIPGINIDVCRLIIEYGGCGVTLQEAMRRRKEIIDLKIHTKSW